MAELTPKQQRFVLDLVGKYAAGNECIVDEDVWFWARNFTWFVGANGYVSTRTGGRTITIHRIIMGNPSGLDVDHSDGDKRNNTRKNLRAATRTENSRNSKAKIGTSAFKGVGLHKCGKWNARITVGPKNHHLGLFVSEEDAARAYDAAAMKHFGEFARLNFPCDI